MQLIEMSPFARMAPGAVPGAVPGAPDD